MQQDSVDHAHHNHKFRVFLVGVTAALAGLLFGLDTGVISGALQFIGKSFGIADKAVELEFIVSSLMWGATIGALTSGLFTRHFGRKKAIMLAGLLFVLGSLGSSLATSPGILIAMRVLLGIAVGMASFTAPLYLSEIAPENVRGAMISLYQLMITIGISLAFMSDTYFASYADVAGTTGGHWRIMIGIIIIPALLMFIGVSFLPESPRWLILKELRDDAIKVLEKMRPSREHVHAEVAEIEEALKIKQSGFSLFKSNKQFRKAIYLGVGLQVIQQLTGINIIMYYAPTVFKAAGFASTVEQMWLTVLTGLVNVFATFIAIAFIDKWGRKPIMYTGFVIMGLSMLIVGICINLGVDTHHVLSFVSVFFVFMFIIGFACSAGPIIWVLCAEIYPLQGRDFGITVSTATNWITNAIVGSTFLTLLNTVGKGNTFILFGVLEALFIVFFIVLVPETKGISLEHIEKNLMSGKRLKDIGVVR